jgi:CRISPR/Cas system-associated exonuclease Cas4 (RecB family)
MSFNRNLIKNLKGMVPKASPTEKFGKAIEAGYLAQKRQPAIVKKRSFAPSSIAYGSGTCPRRWIMSFAGKYMSTENADALGIATMQNGVSGHDRVQRALEASGIVVETEFEVTYDDPPIRAFVDNIVEIDGIKYVVEIKTTDEDKFFIRQTNMKGLDYHYYQLLFYMYILKIERGFLVYENRNNLGIVTIPVELNEKHIKIVEDAFDWMRTVYAAKDGPLPKRPFTKSSWACKSCPLFEACWSEPDGTLELPVMEVHNWS